jgi:hypothetical protein
VEDRLLKRAETSRGAPGSERDPLVTSGHFHCGGGHLATELVQEVFPRGTLPIALLEMLRRDDAALVQDEGPRVRDTAMPVLDRHAEEGLLLGHVLVQEPQPFHHLTSFVGQEREADPVCLAKFSEHFDRVIADGKHRHA